MPGSTSAGVAPAAAARRPGASARGDFWRRHGFQIAVLVPSLIVTAIFVYGFIGYSVRVSISQWTGFVPDLAVREPAYQTYADLMQNPRFQADLRNITIFTVLFLALAVLIGMVLALLVHNVLAGRAIFRALFLFPYSLSFIVVGVVWRWIFTPSTGANQILGWFGVDPGPGWITDPTVAGDVSGQLEALIPGGEVIQVELGIPLAIIPVVVAASWCLGGFAMANFLAALSTISEELHESASLDGAGAWRYHWHIVLPLLRPMLVVVLIILGHVSLKSFDLVYAMAGQGPGFATDVPGIFVFDQMFRALKFNTGAAASVVMLALVVVVVGPYLYRSVIREKR